LLADPVSRLDPPAGTHLRGCPRRSRSRHRTRAPRSGGRDSLEAPRDEDVTPSAGRGPGEDEARGRHHGAPGRARGRPGRSSVGRQSEAQAPAARHRRSDTGRDGSGRMPSRRARAAPAPRARQKAWRARRPTEPRAEHAREEPISSCRDRERPRARRPTACRRGGTSGEIREEPRGGAGERAGEDTADRPVSRVGSAASARCHGLAEDDVRRRDRHEARWSWCEGARHRITLVCSHSTASYEADVRATPGRP
jgi:hypothetical protein